MDGSNYRDAEFISQVAEDVLGVLTKSRFFGRLEDRLSARQASSLPHQCNHSFAISIQILRELGMDAQDIGDVLAVLRFRGAGCDCEVLQNVANGVRMQFWQPTAAEWLINEQKASPFVN